MSKIARYQGNVRAFASDAQGMERTVFGGTNQADDLTSQITASFLRGWGIVGASEHPSLEDFNAAMYAMSQFIAYQHQMGVPEWHAQQEYHIGSICTHNGESYQSLQDANVGSPPPSAKWTPVLTSKNGLANLQLGEAAKRNVGTGTNQIPDMSSFAGGPASGYQKLPSGLIIQWGVSSTSSSTGQATATFPIAFPNGLINVMVSEQSNSAGAVIKWGCGASTKTTSTLWAQGAGGTSPSNGEVANFLAIGW
ncbi:gp53-like domain-containing protein [Citrobacter braakii]|uniref:gp53-like domain-containing protein n=1 Tax=Citrobacter braakii TaxID=57706 RepID=UPI0023B31981|nr:carbohydrate-binding protein [Citrobacter braakii]MDE9583646.1 carbohydrate-binding protein [Citrobacter braakii]